MDRELSFVRQRFSRRAALRLLGAGAGLSLVAATSAPQQAPAASTGQKVSLRWFFWTGTDQEVQIGQAVPHQ